MSASSRQLKAYGVGPDMPTLADIMESRSRKETAAFCHSQECARGKAKIRKLVNVSEDWCPDCGSALVWRRIKIAEV
jgi:predicted RNA-binding Zn-ribbon protein involved in translation (DUF1610 family)